jgi:hypothetical protein
MHTRWDLRLGAALAVLAVATPLVAHASPPFGSSWVDSKHGWRLVHQRLKLQSTENGGRTWHTIFADESGNGLEALRTSKRAGLASIDWMRGAPDTYWTRDNGRHWFLVGSGVIDTGYVGRGSTLYVWHPAWIHQVLGWPPRRAPRCGRPFTKVVGARVCQRATRPPGVRTIELARPEAKGGDDFEDLRQIPRGFVAVAYPSRPWEWPAHTPTVLIRWKGVNRTVALPAPSLPLDLNLNAGHTIRPPRWPRLAVTGKAGRLWSCDSGCLDVTWRSADGGRTWSVETS